MGLLAAWKANEHIAQSNALGVRTQMNYALKGQKSLIVNAFALSGRWLSYTITQGVALSFKLVGLSDRRLADNNDSISSSNTFPIVWLPSW